MSTLVPFTPDRCRYPVAMISEDLPQYIKDILNDCWHKEASGFGDHIDCDNLQTYTRTLAKLNDLCS